MTDFLDYEGLSRFKEDLDGSINDYTTGINLLRGTRDFIQGFGSSTLGYSENGFILSSGAGLRKDADGFTELYNKSGTNSFTYSSQIRGIKPDTDYTLSFKIRHDSGSPQASEMYICRIFCYDETATAVDRGFLKTQRLTSNTLGLTEDGVWKDIHTVFHTPDFDVSDENVFMGVLFYTSHNLNSHSFKMINFVEGNINNPIWSPSPFDIDYINDDTTGVNLIRGTRDFAIGTTQLGTGAWWGYKDGWRKGAPFTITRYDGDFAIATGVHNPSMVNYLISSFITESLKQGEYITVSFEIRIDAETDLSTSRTIGYINYVNSSTAAQLSTISITTSKLGLEEPEVGKWYKVSMPIQITRDIGDDVFIQLLLNVIESVPKISYRKIKVETGLINNPIWSASPFDVAQVGDTLTNANIATPSETLAYVKGSTGSAVTTLPNDGIFIGELPNATPEEGNSTSTLPSEDRPLVGLLKPEQDPDEIEGDDKPWQMM